MTPADNAQLERFIADPSSVSAEQARAFGQELNLRRSVAAVEDAVRALGDHPVAALASRLEAFVLDLAAFSDTLTAENPRALEIVGGVRMLLGSLAAFLQIARGASQ